MFNLLSNAVNAVLGGGDDEDGFFDLASAEEIVQGLEPRGDNEGSFPFPAAEDDAEVEISSDPAPQGATTSLPAEDIPASLQKYCVLSPEEEQAVLELKPIQDVNGSDSLLSNICNEQENIINPDDFATTSDTLERSPGIQTTIPKMSRAGLPGHNALGRDKNCCPEQVHIHSLVMPPQNPTSHDTATAIDVTDSPVTGGLAPRITAEVSTAAVIGSTVAPKLAAISTVKSLTDIVRETKGDKEPEVIFFDDSTDDVFRDATTVLDIATVEETIEPICQESPPKTVQKGVSIKVVPSLSLETKSSGKKG